MSITTVAVMSPGEMGAAVGNALHRGGLEVITCLAGRGEATRERALAAGFREVATPEAMLEQAGLVLSILPPEHAGAQAETIARAIRRTGRLVPYCDCNAVAPDTSRAIGAVIEAVGAPFIDGGIIGNPPGKSEKPTRLFVSGAEAPQMDALNVADIAIRQAGPEIGRASAIKMVYAGISKGTSALHAAVLIAAEKLGVADELHAELEYSTPPLYRRMQNITNALPAVAERYVGEMYEIADTMASAGMTREFHDGAAHLYELLDRTPMRTERRDTVDPDRTLRDTLRICAEYVRLPDAAE